MPENWIPPIVFGILRLRLTVVSWAMRYGDETSLTDTVSSTDVTAESQRKEQTSSSDEHAPKEEPSSSNSDEYFIGSGSSVPTLINIRVVTYATNLRSAWTRLRTVILHIYILTYLSAFTVPFEAVRVTFALLPK